MLDGVDPRDVDGATLTQSELPPASAVPTVKLTSNPVDALVLTPLGEAVTPVTAPDGEAIVSGLLYADVPGVLTAWRAQGFYLKERIDLEGWASLRLAR